MMQVLQYIAQNDQELNFISMLPLAGYDGTLRYRGGLHEAGLTVKFQRRRVHCKGFTILPVLLLPPVGNAWRLYNFYPVMPFHLKTKNRRAPLVRFESRLYKDIYQNN